MFFKKKKSQNDNLPNITEDDIFKYIDIILCINIENFEEKSSNILYYSNKDTLIPILKELPIHNETNVTIFNNCNSTFTKLHFLEHLKISENCLGTIKCVDFLFDEDNENVFFIIRFSYNGIIKHKKTDKCILNSKDNDYTIGFIEDSIYECLHLST